MDTESVMKPGTKPQVSDEVRLPGPSKLEDKKLLTIPIPTTSPATPVGFRLKPSSKGVENAKKRLRAFSIQKKTPITPVAVNKLSSSGTSTVFIGKLTGVKTIPKPEDVEPKKLPPKPPKPGQNRKMLQDSYPELQKRTLSEIEDMKRKMELVELGIPLGLICPSATNEKAMPTKAMPPIKSFLDPAKLDEIINEAKKARAEGRQFKFDYQKLLPDYDNPFQRKKEETEAPNKHESDFSKKIDKEKRETERYERSRYSSHGKDYRDKRDKHRDDRDKRGKSNEKDNHAKAESKKSVEKETDVNLSDYLVCDSWSLDNEDKTNSPKRHDTPQDDKKTPTLKEKPKDNIEPKTQNKIKDESPKTTPIRKIERLQPVIDSFKYELDSNEDEVLDIFDESSDLTRYAKVTQKKDDYDSTFEKMFDYDSPKDASNDALTEDTFLESVINEIKQEDMSDDDSSQDKGLVEYDSPRESASPKDERISVTPELDDRMRDQQSSRSDYSDGYRSTESGYKSTESGYKSNTSFKSDSRSDSRSDSYRSVENDLDIPMPKSTVDSLETWSFVLKICQPLLFRHDRNKCYRESRTLPKIWYTENPKLCTCVKDRAIVYEELEACKMNLVDRVYGCDQILETESPKVRHWYPRFASCLTESSMLPVTTSTEWEADDSQTETPLKDKNYKGARSTTPIRSEEIYLDREYQRFMQAVWPEVEKAGTPRSTTPVREVRKKKGEDIEDRRKKKIKLSSEGWSQESDIEEEEQKIKKIDKAQKAEKVKLRKRKHSSSSTTDSIDDNKIKRKANKKKANKKTKSKLTKRQRLGKKYLKKLKEKQKKKKKQVSEDEDAEKDVLSLYLFEQYQSISKLSAERTNQENRRKEKKLMKKKLQKKKRAQKKKKARAKSSSSSSSTSSSESSSDSEIESSRKKKKKKSDVKKKKRKQSSSESTQSEELFDVNVLNNIKTERLTDDEKKLDFSPRRQKPREIINVKELQNDFVGSVHVKKEVEDIVGKEKEGKEEEKENEGKEKESELEKKIQIEEKEFATESVSEISEIIESVSQSLPESVTESVSQTLPEGGNDSVQTLLENIPVPTVDIHYIPIPKEDIHFKEPLEVNRTQDRPESQPEESNLSQCSSQESTISNAYEKDDSHLRPSSQNSNYSFNDVISASQNYQKEEEKFEENYGNYEMYEQLAMAYQSDVAKQSGPISAGEWWGSQRIETVVRARPRGEIKCDWRAGESPATSTGTGCQQRPSRWGLKPGEVNIVLTGGNNEQYHPIQHVEPVYQIQSLASNRAENNSTGSYDEAYEDMYGASDRLQYGDCFATEAHATDTQPDIEPRTQTTSSLDDRINIALRSTVLGDIGKLTEETESDKDGPEKGILLTKTESRGAKRVSFADGYKPGQDSDVEDPPKKKKKPRRFGCAWPCPASHPDHVPLWDALPPPPPPPGSPPHQPSMMQPPPMLQQQMLQQQMLQQQMLQQQGLNPMLQPPFVMGPKMDASGSLPNFMPPEPPPGLITFQ